jgi:L-aspartate oxidase
MKTPSQSAPESTPTETGSWPSPAEAYDFLVLGSGLAALVFALECAKKGSVCVLTKGQLDDSATSWAQGGVAAVTAPDDSVEDHTRDTVNAGAGLCDEDVVRGVVADGPEAIDRLVEWGVDFTRRTDGSEDYDLGREGGHSRRRVLHADDFTGRAIQQRLQQRALDHPRIDVFEQMMVVDLITDGRLGLRDCRDDQGPDRCHGVYAIDKRNQKVRKVLGRATLLATGGAGKVYLYTSNPEIATGDGVAMAYRAGCRVANMEFFQFHPTCLYHHSDRAFLISEALRGEGGVLRNLDGEAFMGAYDERAELAPRDIVARGIDSELKRSGNDHVWLDMTALDPDFLAERFPNIHARLLKLGIDMSRDPIPVVPAAHYSCGGVLVDEQGRTGIDGLWAAGEVCCSGLHGANRLASNSLLEGAVYARRAAADATSLFEASASEDEPRTPEAIPSWNARFTVEADETVVVTQNWDEIRRFMWNYVGIVRSNNRLTRAKRRIQALRDEIDADYWKYYPFQDLIELRNLALVAELIIDSAISRQESRGLHHNVDYPKRDDQRFTQNTILWKGRV